MTPVLERLLRRAAITAFGCWEWQGTTVVGGYGRAKVGSRTDGTRRSALVHRIAWEECYGPIPEGLTVDHLLCNNPPCFNPEHLAVTSMRTNTLRSALAPTAINARKKSCPKCGGPLTTRTGGKGRDCRPCRLAYLREYNATRRPTRTRRNTS